MEQNIFVVDAFTSTPFAGNPAGVCLLEEPAEETWMQSLAAEMRHSETAFLVKTGEGAYDLRWFTPVAEIKLCGHATLASAHVLFNHGFEPEAEELRFSTLSGILKAVRKEGQIQLDFPVSEPKSVDLSGNVQKIFGFVPKFVGNSPTDHLLVVAPDEAEVVNAAPDPDALSELPNHAVIITAESDRDGVDVVSRMFAPKIGIYEDPVTGSAHCVLTPYWTEQLSKDPLSCYQASERGGSMLTHLNGNRVELLGESVTIFSGTLSV